jgi:outer membrane protein, heavy metal efflux system
VGHWCCRKTPSAARTFTLSALVALLWSGGAGAEPISEALVVRAARTWDPEAVLAREEARLSETRELQAGIHPNPVLGWEREKVSSQSEDSIVVTVPIDVSGRRAARRRMARSETASSRALAARARTLAVRRALYVHHDAIAAKRRTEIARRAVTRLDEAARVLGRREQAGTIAGYELHRLEVEAELARSALAEAEAEQKTLRRELALLIGRDPDQVEPVGTLEVAPATPASAAGTPRSIREARSAAAEAQAASRAASSAWIPPLALSGGIKLHSADETRAGYVIGAALELPLFSRGQGIADEALARRDVAAAEARAAERASKLEAERASRSLQALRAELARFQAQTGERVERLERAAESGYREGQRSLVELLDAQRARTSVELRALELALAAKRAETALRAARGELE